MLRLRENKSAYDRYLIRPRVLRNVSTLDTSTTILGTKVKFPFGLSPTAMQALAHKEGEVATSKAAATNGILMGLSNYSTIALEDVIAQGNGNPYAMQMSLLKNKDAMVRMIKRAEGELPDHSILRDTRQVREYRERKTNCEQLLDSRPSSLRWMHPTSAGD